jgi:NAD(P)H dehydrogenase (quinone)
MTVIGVTGASGRFGRRIGELVTSDPRSSDVVLTTRNPDAVDYSARPNVEVRAADFDRPDSLAEAFAGVDRLLVISADVPGVRVEQHKAAFAGAAEAGVGQIFYTSMVDPVEDHPSAPLARDHRETEAALRATGVPWTILRFGFFTESLVGGAGRAIESGRLVSNAGAGVATWVAIRDCAAVATEVLLEGDHSGQVYDVVGPERISYLDIVKTLSELSGREVELVELDDASYRDGLLSGGVSAADADEYTSFGVAIREGYVAKMNNVIEALTGVPPWTVRDVFEAAGVGKAAGDGR